jgi:hypothetical protein
MLWTICYFWDRFVVVEHMRNIETDEVPQSGPTNYLLYKELSVVAADIESCILWVIP